VAASIEELDKLREASAESAPRLKAAVLDLAKRPEYATVARALRRQAGVGPFTAIRLRRGGGRRYNNSSTPCPASFPLGKAAIDHRSP
jgi:hypothetical protein